MKKYNQIIDDILGEAFTYRSAIFELSDLINKLESKCEDADKELEKLKLENKHLIEREAELMKSINKIKSSYPYKLYRFILKFKKH